MPPRRGQPRVVDVTVAMNTADLRRHNAYLRRQVEALTIQLKGRNNEFLADDVDSMDGNPFGGDQTVVRDQRWDQGLRVDVPKFDGSLTAEDVIQFEGESHPDGFIDDYGDPVYDDYGDPPSVYEDVDPVYDDYGDHDELPDKKAEEDGLMIDDKEESDGEIDETPIWDAEPDELDSSSNSNRDATFWEDYGVNVLPCLFRSSFYNN